MKLKNWNIGKVKFEFNVKRNLSDDFVSEDNIREQILSNCKYILENPEKIHFTINESYKNISVTINPKKGITVMYREGGDIIFI